MKQPAQLSARANASAAKANVRAGVAGMEAFNADHATGYKGVTLTILQASYDRGIKNVRSPGCPAPRSVFDFPSGPEFPRLVLFAWPGSGDLGNAVPLVALTVVLRDVWSLLPDKLLLLAPVFLGGLGVYRFARTRLGVGVFPGLYGGTVFVLNPFVADRYLAGQLFYLLGYAHRSTRGSRVLQHWPRLSS